MTYEVVIGLEVHLQLKTKTKAFCGCSTEFGAEPNTQVCPVCMGFPGTLPVFNSTALDYGIKVALALNCAIQEHTKFDRKNYFYPDLPKAYQISQYDLPLSRNGQINVEMKDGPKRVGITRVHMEEDAGKLIHQEDYSCVDYNRTGIPLLEIVSEPDIRSPEEAYQYLVTLKSIIAYLDVSDCDMEKGSLRCDANISLKPAGQIELGTKTELKNLNSFKAVKDSLNFEIKRQTQELNNNKKIIQETRLWDEKVQQTQAMRTKEGAQDYRYFPEPDLPELKITQDKINELKSTLPELPHEKMLRFMKEYGLSVYDSGILVYSRTDASYAEECMKAYSSKDKKAVANWLNGTLLFEANARNTSISSLKIAAVDLIELIGYIDKEAISNLTAKEILTEMIESKKTAGVIIKDKNLMQISDTETLDEIARDIIKENPKSVADFKAGKNNALMFLVGQVMRKSGGKANPKVVQELLKGRLTNA